jgi:CxxC-x17-CxxC domain-containing protein
MEFQDKWINCVNCGKPFVFSERDQRYYTEQGFKNEPKRCRECRALLKRQKQVTLDEDGVEKELFKAECAACGRATYVPFKPTGSKPIYCRDCLVAKKIEEQVETPVLPVAAPEQQPPAAI